MRAFTCIKGRCQTTEEKRDITKIKPPFSVRFKEFLGALGEYFKYCIKPQPTDCLGKKVLNPDWYMARSQIDEEKILPSDDGFTMRDKSFANIAMANAKLKSLKWNYHWHKKCAKQLKENIKIKFNELIR